MYNKKAVASFFMDTIKEQVAKRQAEGQFIKIPNLMGMVINKNDDTNDTEKVYDVEVAPVGEVLSIPTDEECGEPRALGTDMVTLVMKIEGGIKTALSSVAKDETNNLSNMTSVAVDFFIKGLRQHYIRFDKTPSTLNRSNKKNNTAAAKIKEGGIGLSKKDKNRLDEQSRFIYYLNDINSGLITMEEANESMIKAAEELLDKTKGGMVFITGKKTEGISLFDWKKEVRYESNIEDDRWKYYQYEKFMIKVPHFDKMSSTELLENKRYRREIEKVHPNLLKSDTSVFLKLAMSLDTRLTNEMKKLIQGHTLMGAHIIQIKKTISLQSATSSNILSKERFLLLDYNDDKTYEATFIITDMQEDGICATLYPEVTPRRRNESSNKKRDPNRGLEGARQLINGKWEWMYKKYTAQL